MYWIQYGRVLSSFCISPLVVFVHLQKQFCAMVQMLINILVDLVTHPWAWNGRKERTSSSVHYPATLSKSTYSIIFALFIFKILIIKWWKVLFFLLFVKLADYESFLTTKIFQIKVYNIYLVCSFAKLFCHSKNVDKFYLLLLITLDEIGVLIIFSFTGTFKIRR